MNLKNNLLLSIRHLKADKTNTLINIAGLVLGLSIVTVVIVFILNELGYNSAFGKRENIYRVLNYNSSDLTTWAESPFIIGEMLPGRFAEVDKCAHIYNSGNIEIKKENDFIHEKNMFCTESSFFDIFGVKVLQRSLEGFDKTDNKVLISRGLSKKYLGIDSPVGRLLTLRCMGIEFPMVVTAVFEDFPENTTIKASIIAGIDFGFRHLSLNLISTAEKKPDANEFRESWKNGLFFTNYILLKKGADVDAFEKKLNLLGSEHSSENDKLSLSLQPLTGIYFGSGKIVDNNGGEQGNLPMWHALTILILPLHRQCLRQKRSQYARYAVLREKA